MSTGSTRASIATRISQRRAAWQARVTPTAAGLPNAIVWWSFPGLVLLGFGVLVLLSVSGSSTGVFWQYFGQGPDPDLLAGTPRGVRSDEWLVQSSWVISQVSQGFPSINHVFPGGTDATVMNDLPSWDWSTLFRPHTWGLLFLGVDHGMAFRWWLPAALVAVTVYWFVVSVLPRRPLLGAALALVVILQPIVQWWWLPVVLLPVAFAFATATAVVWAVRASTWRRRLVPAVLAGYLAVDMAMSIYVPSMIAAIVATAAFAVGYLVLEWRSGTAPRVLVRRMVPLLGAGAAAAAVLVAWVLTRRDTVDALLSTVYPGQRLTPTGTGTSDDLLSLLSAPFQRSLQYDDLVPSFGANASEGSSVLLVSLFLLPALVSVAFVVWRRNRRVDWLVAALVAVQLFLLAFLFVPGWDSLAHLIGIDRAVPQRTRLAFVVLAVMVVVVLVERLDELDLRASWPGSLLGGAVALASSAWVWRRLAGVDSAAVPSVWSVAVIALLVVSVVAFARRAVLLGGVALLVGSLVVGAGVNPVYRGVFDLREQTEAGRAVVRIAGAEPDGAWVGVGSYVSMATLVEAGVRAYSGVQTYPSRTMWRHIDPDGQAEDAWNRLAHVYWEAGTGDPDPRQPPSGQADVIQLTFDSCTAFAQEHVTFVLVDGPPIDQPCVSPLRRVRQNGALQWIYRVVPPPAG
ncbi:hypothetical protein [Nocardioides sp. W7]|uniref:DUF7657 domain-containing protein n=1 Tax=Nocardioides sp. W7 TaxID=2931390 RepID=UPI001FD45013|nr:hypothetical protein [Nocardioides sp. W7]